MDDSEKRAVLKFLQYFMKTYRETLPILQLCTFSEAIKTCFGKTERKKVLLLYLHNETDDFSKMFCKCLVSGEIRRAIEERCFLLAWDVRNVCYHESLIRATSANTNLGPILEKFIKGKCSGLFVVLPVANIPTIFSCMRGDVKENDLLGTLKQCIKSLEESYRTYSKLEDIEKERSTGFTSEEFQQLMFNQLGDRDYDRFEEDEHELLKNKIGFSLYGPPQHEAGYEKKQQEHIEKIYKKIISCNDEISKWKNNIVVSFIYVCTEPLPEEKVRKATEDEKYDPRTDVIPFPLYVLRKCKGSDNPCRIFIDAFDLRVYESWNDYIINNQLHECLMILPKNGRYSGDVKGNVLLEEHLSPACGIDKLLVKGADVAGVAAGFFSGGVFAAAMIPAITVAPILLTTATIAGAGFGVYSILRSSFTLFDRFKHKQDVTLTDSEARGAYINIVAGSLGFVGAGANLAVSQLVSKGVVINQGAILTVDLINVANISASGIGIANASYDVYDQWRNNNRVPSLLTIVQLSSSVLFFGNAVYNYRTTGTIIEETQANTLKDMQDSLRSNRQRKTLNKLIKETIRQSGDTQVGRAEVISTMHVVNKDKVIGILTRSNKLFNKNNVRFAAKNGQITLNGVPVKIQDFGGLSKDQILLSLVDLPGIPPTPEKIDVVFVQVKQVFNTTTTVLTFGHQIIQNGLNFASLAATLLQMYKDDVKEKIFYILRDVVEEFKRKNFDFVNVLKTTLPHENEPLIIVLKLILQFLKSKVYELDDEYQRRKTEAQKSPDFDEEKFNSEYWVLPSTVQRAMHIFELIVDAYVNNTNPTDFCLRSITDYCIDKLANLIYNYAEKKTKSEKRRRNLLIKKKCTICNGYYYSV